jgi:hypothetical protein
VLAMPALPQFAAEPDLPHGRTKDGQAILSQKDHTTPDGAITLVPCVFVEIVRCLRPDTVYVLCVIGSVCC